MISKRQLTKACRMRVLLWVFLSFTLVVTAEETLPSPVVSEARTVFLKTWELVESNFYDSKLNGVDIQKLKTEYLKRLEAEPERVVELTNRSLASLESSHTQLFHQDDPLYYELLDVFSFGPMAKEIRKRFNGELPWYAGILARFDGGIVKAVVPGGPAFKAGLLAGDEIVSVAGKPFQAVESFRGKAGMSLSLTVKRDGKLLEFQVTPERIQPRQAFLRSISDSAQIFEEPPYRLGYVRMWSYAGEAYQDRLRELLLGKLKSTDGLILDLRGSWGGASPEFAQLFLSQTDFVMKPRGREPFILESSSYSAPLYILIDESVSSGKEILAYNLQKSGRAKLVGSPTRGAVLGGELHLLPGGHALYLARADAEIDGRKLERLGVTPDHYLPQEYHVAGAEDDLIRNAKGEFVLELIKRDLKHRWFTDQKPRTQGGSTNWDLDNQAWLKTVLERYGWPSREAFGESAQTAFLIAQHADNDLELQRNALELLSRAVEDGRAPAKERAYLEDRILVNQGLPQIYGTQVTVKDGKAIVREVRDPENLDERRRAVGLPPIDDYLKMFEK